MGRKVEKTNAKTGDINYTFHTPSGPPPGAGDRCGECGGKYHVRLMLFPSLLAKKLTSVSAKVGGPMWGAPIHDQEFVSQMLQHVEQNSSDFGTSARIVGMLSVAKAVRFSLEPLTRATLIVTFRRAGAP